MRPGRRTLVRIVLSSMMALGLASCAKDDNARILGHWRAERFKVMSLNLPISPEFVIKKDELAAVGTDLSIPITSISHDGDEVTLNTTGGLGLLFYFEGRDRMYFDVPLLGKIYYQRVNPVPQDVHITDPTKNASTTSASVTAVPPARHVPADPAPAIAAAPGADSPVKVTATGNGSKPAGLQAAGSKVEERVAPVVASVPDNGNSLLHRLVRTAEREMGQGNLEAAQRMLMDARRLDPSHPLVDYQFAILKMKQGDSEGAIHHLKDAFGHGFRAFVLLEANPDLGPLKSDSRYNVLVAQYR